MEEKKHIFIVVGFVAIIIIWVSAYYLYEDLLKDKSTEFKRYFNIVSLIIALAILFWLAKNHPRCIGFK